MDPRNEVPNGQPQQQQQAANGLDGGGRDLIDLMNDLQSKLVASGHSLDVNLPQIAVVGSQSAGKSSVLENIVGREFLPRGKGVVTRRPTLIQLYPTKEEEYGVFGHKPDERFFDFGNIRHEISAQMPPPNTFDSRPIQLKIYSPRVLKLTLVDLPGLVRVALTGHRQQNVSEVREMVLRHISNPECIILAVTPACQDLATSDALEIARKVDPHGLRTIGVLTKLDLMDPGTDAREILENKQIELKRGYVGVVNRSQEEIESGRDIDHILNKEREFIESKPCYSHLRDRMGTPVLQRLLQRTLKSHIKTSLPSVREKLGKKLDEFERQLKDFQSKAGEGQGDRQLFMLKHVNKFIADVEMKLMGNSELMDMSKLSAGAIINKRLNTDVQRYLKLDLEPDQRDLTILIPSLAGMWNILTIPPHALDAPCRKLMAEFEEPMKKSVECIQKVLEIAIEESAELLSSYSATKHEVLFKTRRCIEKESARTIEKLNEHIEAEMYFVNTMHPEMLACEWEPLILQASDGQMWNNQSQPPAEPAASPSDEPQFIPPIASDLGSEMEPLVAELMGNEVIQKKVRFVTQVIKKYVQIVQKQITDLTVKYICCFLIKKVMIYIKDDLTHSLMSDSNFTSLTEDCEEDFRKKEEMESMKVILEEALRAIADF
ncbi:hypothetical protein JTE90_025131 [Oedothorax gibbosus]|uniref:dynamin GTPase n=1 Tax=Oedothorax gibbosus TaxID=931172 RepID=A0AAV6UJY2_9ARAC|nr:hypothetical protein JTE90_025131 [Oedothorax gibbosus]